MTSPEIWSKIYVKGHYESIHLLRNTKRTGCVDDYPKVYYIKDPINFKMAGMEIPVDTQSFISDNP